MNSKQKCNLIKSLNQLWMHKQNESGLFLTPFVLPSYNCSSYFLDHLGKDNAMQDMTQRQAGLLKLFQRMKFHFACSITKIGHNMINNIISYNFFLMISVYNDNFGDRFAAKYHNYQSLLDCISKSYIDANLQVTLIDYCQYVFTSLLNSTTTYFLFAMWNV